MQVELIPREVLDGHSLTFSVCTHTLPTHTHTHTRFSLHEACVSSALNQCWALADTTYLLAENQLPLSLRQVTSLSPMPLCGKACRRMCVCVRPSVHIQVTNEAVGPGIQEPGHPRLPAPGTGADDVRVRRPALALFLLWSLTRCPVYPGLLCPSFPLLSLLSTPGIPTVCLGHHRTQLGLLELANASVH